MEHATYRQWLDLELDGALDAPARAELARHLEGCADCRAERRRLERLGESLRADRVEVRPGFAAAVMAALPDAPAAAPRAWALPVAVLGLLVAVALALWGVADPLTGAGGLGSAAGALADLFRAALVAGSGLAAASWRGLGAAIGEWLGASPANWVAAGVLVVAVNLLAYRLVRAARRPARAATRR